MPTLEKRGEYWRVKIRRIGFPNQTRSFDTKAQAQRWSRDLERDMDRGFFVDRTEFEKNSRRDLIERYVREVTPTKRGAGPESSRLNAMMLRPIGEINVAALSSKHIAAYRDQRLKQVSSGTVIKELNHLSHIIETARREWGIQLPENPVKLVRRPPSPKSRSRRLVADEAQRLVDACADARNPFYFQPSCSRLKPQVLQGTRHYKCLNDTLIFGQKI